MKPKKSVITHFIFIVFFYSISAEAVEQEERTLEEEVMYSIVVDRFFDGNSENNR